MKKSHKINVPRGVKGERLRLWRFALDTIENLEPSDKYLVERWVEAEILAQEAREKIGESTVAVDIDGKVIVSHWEGIRLRRDKDARDLWGLLAGAASKRGWR